MRQVNLLNQEFSLTRPLGGFKSKDIVLLSEINKLRGHVLCLWPIAADGAVLKRHAEDGVVMV